MSSSWILRIDSHHNAHIHDNAKGTGRGTFNRQTAKAPRCSVVNNLVRFGRGGFDPLRPVTSQHIASPVQDLVARQSQPDHPIGKRTRQHDLI